jgi:hypothetical protein
VKESDYIAAQNLWRVRLAHEMVRGMVFTSKTYSAWQAELIESLYELEEALGKLVGR